MQRLLLIVNPCAGTKRIPRFFPQIIELFRARGFESTVYMTNGRGDATDIVRERGGDFDRIVCAGGDGTFNEVITGLLSAGLTTPLGYIPCGSTNDFATTLRLPKTIMEAAASAAGETSCALDVGQFGDRYFSYVASFGSFTQVAYSAPQDAKNILGYAAYLLEGIKSLSEVKPYALRIRAAGEEYTGKFIFGAVSNALSVGGMVKFDSAMVDLSDGLFEILMIRYPQNLADLQKILHDLATHHYDSDLILYFKAEEVTVESDEPIAWTVDGEMGGTTAEARVRNCHRAIRILKPEEEEHA